VLEQNSHASWQSLIGDVKVNEDRGGEADLEVQADDELTSFKL